MRNTKCHSAIPTPSGLESKLSDWQSAAQFEGCTTCNVGLKEKSFALSVKIHGSTGLPISIDICRNFLWHWRATELSESISMSLSCRPREKSVRFIIQSLWAEGENWQGGHVTWKFRNSNGLHYSDWWIQDWSLSTWSLGGHAGSRNNVLGPTKLAWGFEGIVRARKSTVGQTAASPKTLFCELHCMFSLNFLHVQNKEENAFKWYYLH